MGVAQKLIKARRSCSLSIQEVSKWTGRGGEGGSSRKTRDWLSHSFNHTHTHTQRARGFIYQSINLSFRASFINVISCLCFALPSFISPPSAGSTASFESFVSFVACCFCCPLPILLRFCLAHRRIRRMGRWKWRWRRSLDDGRKR